MSTLLQKYENGQLVYPNPIQNGLVLWYDMAGKRNTDADKETIEDFSGNKAICHEEFALTLGSKNNMEIYEHNSQELQDILRGEEWNKQLQE